MIKGNIIPQYPAYYASKETTTLDLFTQFMLLHPSILRKSREVMNTSHNQPTNKPNQPNQPNQRNQTNQRNPVCFSWCFFFHQVPARWPWRYIPGKHGSVVLVVMDGLQLFDSSEIFAPSLPKDHDVNNTLYTHTHHKRIQVKN